MINHSSLRRFEIPTATGSSRIVSLPAVSGTIPAASRLSAPKTLATFQDLFQAALSQAQRDHELNRLFNADFYEI